MEHVGVRIDEIRRQWGLTVEELSEQSDIPMTRLNFILQEGGCPLGPAEAVAIAIVLRSVSPRDLLIYQVNHQLETVKRNGKKPL